MARILYGVAGEGFGHCSRAHLIGQHLLQAGHEVMFVGFAKSPLYLRPIFGERVKEILGLSFAYRNGRIDKGKTLAWNLRRFPGIVRANRGFFRSQVDGFAPDVVLSDFEPFSAWWARRNGVPLVSVDNEHLLTHCRVEHAPGQLVSRLTAAWVTRAYAFRADAYVILSFFDAPVTRRSVLLAPPVVRSLVTELRPSEGDYLVVYVSTGQGRESWLEVLRGFPMWRFHVYGFDQDTGHGNCVLKARSTEGFLRDMAGSRGVIASAGFSLVSECMALRKRMLLIPVAGQYEQLLNARAVERLGLGTWDPHLSPAALSRFLDRLDRPLGEGPGILWPDNERFLSVLQTALAGLPVSVERGLGRA